MNRIVDKPMIDNIEDTDTLFCSDGGSGGVVRQVAKETLLEELYNGKSAQGSFVNINDSLSGKAELSGLVHNLFDKSAQPSELSNTPLQVIESDTGINITTESTNNVGNWVGYIIDVSKYGDKTLKIACDIVSNGRIWVGFDNVTPVVDVSTSDTRVVREIPLNSDIQTLYIYFYRRSIEAGTTSYNNLVISVDNDKYVPYSGNDYEGYGENEFDGNNITSGAYLGKDGSSYSKGKWGYSDFIKCEGSQAYYIKYSLDLLGNAPSVCFYDDDKTYISGKNYSNNNPFGVTTPINARYMKITFVLSDIDSVELRKAKKGYAVRSCSNNLLPYPYTHTTQTSSGVTFTDNGDGTITVNDTATANYSIFVLVDDFILKANTPYKISGFKGVTTYLRHNENGNVKYISIGDDTTVTLNDDSAVRIYIQISNGKGYDNVTIEPMVEKIVGDESNYPHPYEPYTEKQTVITNDMDTAYVDTYEGVTNIFTDYGVPLNVRYGNKPITNDVITNKGNIAYLMSLNE